MTEPIRHPFTDYQPPELDKIFSEQGKMEILEFKLETLQEDVKARMLEGNQIEELLRKGSTFSANYDCSRLRAFGPIELADPEVEVELVKRIILGGVSQAITDTGSIPPGGGLSLHVHHYTDPDNPDVLNVDVRIVDPV